MHSFFVQFFAILLMLLGLLNPTFAQDLVSQCPHVFNYEPKNSAEPRWYGTINLRSDSDLKGIWLRIVFDKTSIQLGNWFGEAVTEDNISYLIKNKDFTLKANNPLNLRIYLKYTPGGTPPKIVEIRLNARTICSVEHSTTSVPLTIREYTSALRSISSKVPQIHNSSLNDNVQPHLAAFRQPGPKHDLEVQCGTVVVKVSPTPLITYGQTTHHGEFPWHAGLYFFTGTSLGFKIEYICGASLITKNHVITAAHCVTISQSKELQNYKRLVLYFGKYFLQVWFYPMIQARHIVRISVPKQYDPQSFNNDIAILKLSKPVEISNYVRPVCLWSEDASLNSVIGREGTVAGWGHDKSGKLTNALQKNKMPIVSQETCIFSNPSSFSQFISNKTFCAGYLNGSSVCNGDSGGGMVFLKTGTNTQIWQLRGLVSASLVSPGTFKCDTSHYAIFTDVAKHLEWIKAVLT